MICSYSDSLQAFARITALLLDARLDQVQGPGQKEGQQGGNVYTFLEGISPESLAWSLGEVGGK